MSVGRHRRPIARPTARTRAWTTATRRRRWRRARPPPAWRSRRGRPSRAASQEEDVVLGDPFWATAAPLDRVKRVLRVDHQRHLGPGRTPRARHLDPQSSGPGQALVRVRAGERRLSLAAVTQVAPASPSRHQADIRLEGRHLRLRGRIRRQRLAAPRPTAASGTPCGPTPQVPKRDVDRPDRVHSAPRRPVMRCRRTTLPDHLDVGRVAADQKAAAPVHRVRPRGVDAGAGDPRGVSLADPSRPSSVSISTTMVSCAELVAPTSSPGSSRTCVRMSTMRTARQTRL